MMIMSFGIMILPGLMSLLLFEPDVLVIKRATNYQTIVLALLYSFIVCLISCIWIAHERRIIKKLQVGNIKLLHVNKITVLVFINIMVLLGIIFTRRVENIPLFHLLRFDALLAAEIKYQYMHKLIPTAPEVLNQYLRFFSSIAFFYCVFNFRRIQGNAVMKIILTITTFLLALIFFALDGHKSPAFLLVIGMLLLISVRKQKLIHHVNILIGLLVMISFYSLFASTISLGDRNLLEVFAERLFYGQMSGTIFIMDRFAPDLELLKHGFIGASHIFDNLPRKADSIIMEEIYGISSTNVNMNSFFISEAFSWGGHFGIWFSIIFMFLYVIAVLHFLKFVSGRCYEIYYPLSASFFIFYFPILQGFNTFLYGRNLIFFVVFSSIFVFFRRSRFRIS